MQKGIGDNTFNGERDARRGTKLWALNYIRGRILVKLIVDLKAIEKGFSDDVCAVVRKLLFTLLEELRQIPDGGFQRDRLLKELEDFDKIYHDWNNIEGEDEYAAQKRMELLNELQKRRHKVSGVIRRGQREFYTILDEKMVEAVFLQLRNLLDQHEDKFPHLKLAYIEFISRSGERFALP